MKKRMILIGLSLAFATLPSLAAIPLLPKVFGERHKPKPSLPKIQTTAAKGYANFSGHWVGTCASDPSEEVILDIDQNADFSQLSIDNEVFLIDAISTREYTKTLNTENNIVHLRWSKNGQKILGSILSYSKEGYMSQGDLNVVTGKFNMLVENSQLIINHKLTIFIDGSLDSNFTERCTYSKA